MCQYKQSFRKIISQPITHESNYMKLRKRSARLPEKLSFLKSFERLIPRIKIKSLGELLWPKIDWRIIY